MFLSDAKRKVIKLIDDYSVNGTVTSASDGNRQDYSNKFNDFFDVAQKEIATTAKYINAVYKISQNPLPTLLSNPLMSFDIIQHTNTDITTMSAVGAKTYSFEVDDEFTAFVEEKINNVWTLLADITPITLPTGYTVYKGFITAGSALNEVRIRFSGSYTYNIRNRALWAYAFSNVNKIPKYEPYNLYTMPTDFFKLNKVTFKTNTRQYTNVADFYWEPRNVIALNYYNIGEYSIFYYKYPTTINDSTADTYEFEIDPEAQEALPYYVASECLKYENPDASVKLFAQYQNKLGNLSNSIAKDHEAVSNTLFSATSSTKLF